MTVSNTQLEREILQQPAVLQRMLDEERANTEQIARLIRQRNPRHIIIVARGSSDNAARYAQYLFGSANQLVVGLATPSLFTLYGKPPRVDSALIIAISQSGQSPDIVSVINEGRRQGAFTLALVNDMDSPLAHAAEATIHLRAGQEVSVAATKTYTASLMAIAMLSAALYEDDSMFRALQEVPRILLNVTERADEIIQRAERYRYMQACVVLSRGYNYSTAFEIALKMKELTYVLAEPYSSADFKHGPVALVEEGFPVVAVVPEGVITDELTEFLHALNERGAELLVISSVERALSYAQTPLVVPSGMPEWASPLVMVVPGQLFSLGLTLAKGFKPDSPRGLRKVTLTQ